MTKPVDLDYAVLVRPYPLWFRLSLLLAAIGVLVSLGVMYQAMHVQLAAQQASEAANKTLHRAVSRNPQLDEALAFALQTQQSLNYPWLQTLSALETVKIQHPKIDLLSVNPNKEKSEIMLVGEASTFDDITRFINDLKANAAFGDAVLINQHLVEPDSVSQNNGGPIYTFTLNLNWRQ